MTLTDINKALSNLAELPTRENILTFSFELLQWMNITPNADNKPQLLSPQTQKLKDYLANAPQTVQPQLYRLSADNQQIRVRFAVLKKLKKEYISQLVDNDPGLGSYQAMAKGLTIPATGTAFIPAQPYFVHFVTTPDYDKLVLIFNQGEQKRIVSFRNRLTNTQYHKIIQAWQGIGVKSKPEIADLLWKSLDIKEVNKEFYKQVKERFDALLGIVKTQHNTATENQVKQFTVRMIGRYIFCWFLKEKGIIPHSLISKQTIESTEKYYQTVLLKLFFETLNTKVQDRDPLKHNKLFEKIPYLNGGLFDESEEDKLFTKLDLDPWLLPFVEILESYDFTVDESSSQYQQVAVDPEMLGRIFENLLASQNEETEKLANQRKAFGAFYTPREIVDYMVNESIKAYLQTQWEQHIEADKTKNINNPEPIGDIFGNKKPQQLAIEIKRYELKPDEKQKIEKALEPLFASNPDSGHLKKDEKTLLLCFLEQIKILDPACGSGAFPMGILHKLVELHEALGTVKSSYELKKDILSQNIYGVDIMPMAIEIARLRAWLSLVLEENYKPTDPKHNFGVKPLPNLDFKFVCANSLIDLGLDAFIQESKGTLHEGFTQNLVKDLKDLETLRTNFFNPTLASSQKEQLKTAYFENRDKVITDIEAAHDPILKQIAKKIKYWNPFDDSQPSPFFSPTWMFGIDKGFDVVIGNPPYVRQETAGIDRESFQKRFKSFSGKADLYVYFYEQGINLLKHKGVLCFITSSKFIKAGYGKPLLAFISDYSEIKNVIDFNDLPVFNGITTYPVVISTLKGKSNNYVFKFYSLDELPTSSLEELLNRKTSKVFTKNEFVKSDYKFIDDDNFKLLSKIKINSIDLKEYCGSPVVGIKTGLNDAYIVDENIQNTKPYIFGRDIKKYQPVISNKRIIFPYDEGFVLIPTSKLGDAKDILIKNKKELSNRAIIKEGLLKGTKQWYEYQQVNRTIEFDKPYIIFPNVSLGNNFSIALNVVVDMTAFILKSDSLYLLAILNSKLTEYLMQIWAIERRGGYLEYKTQYVEKLLIKKISESLQQPFISRVEKILSLKKKNHDTTSLEKEIDVLVYKLYELTYDEVKIIDKDFWLSEEEYNNYKMQ